MKLLSTLAQILSQQKVHQIDVFTGRSSLDNKSKILYDYLQNGENPNDLEAKNIIYGDLSNNDAYRKLKNRLTHRLLNTSFLINLTTSSKTESKVQTLRAHRYWAAYKLLSLLGYGSKATSLLKNAHSLSKKNNLFELNLLVCKELKKIYGLYDYNKRESLKYNKLYAKYLDQYLLQSDIEGIYIHLGHIVESTASSEYNEEIKDYENQLRALKDKVLDSDLYYVLYQFHQCEFFIEMIKRNFKKQLVIAQKAKNYFDNNVKEFTLGRFIFTQLEGISLLGLKRFQNASEIFHSLEKFNLREGTLSWQSTYHYQFVCAILTNDYNTAHDVLCKVIQNKNFKKLYDEFRQQWYIKEAYIHLLVQMGIIDTEKTEKQLKRFSLNKFLNEVPSLSRDKKGYNVTIQILQLLFLIVKRDQDRILIKIESLRQYKNRYLKAKAFRRSHIFISMLFKLTDANYKIDLVQEKTAKLRSKMEMHPMDFSEQAMSIEIIPYEQMWESIITYLSRKGK